MNYSNCTIPLLPEVSLTTKTKFQVSNQGPLLEVTNFVFLSFIPVLNFSVDVRLQFRLPDGSTVTDNFPPDTPLDTAREFICSVCIPL